MIIGHYNLGINTFQRILKSRKVIIFFTNFLKFRLHLFVALLKCKCFYWVEISPFCLLQFNIWDKVQGRFHFFHCSRFLEENVSYQELFSDWKILFLTGVTLRTRTQGPFNFEDIIFSWKSDDTELRILHYSISLNELFIMVWSNVKIG